MTPNDAHPLSSRRRTSSPSGSGPARSGRPPAGSPPGEAAAARSTSERTQPPAALGVVGPGPGLPGRLTATDRDGLAQLSATARRDHQWGRSPSFLSGAGPVGSR